MAQRIADVQAGGLCWVVAERMARSWATPTLRNGACAMLYDFQSSRDEWTGHAAYCPFLLSSDGQSDLLSA
jgi:hypothetical protein